MTTAITKTNAASAPSAPQKMSALKLMASRLSVEPEKLLQTLKATVFSKATDDELLALVVVANEYGLNPFLKEIYAFPAKGGGIVPIVSVDGWNKMLIRQPDFDGIEWESADDNEGNPVSLTAVIHVKGRGFPVRVTEYYDECKRNTEPWNNMPRRMLRNRTLCQASRMAFGFSGVMNEDEAATVIDISATPMPSEPPPKLVAAPATDKITPQQELEGIILAEGYPLDLLLKYGAESGNIANAHEIASFAEISTDEARRLVRAKVGLLAALKQMQPAPAK